MPVLLPPPLPLPANRGSGKDRARDCGETCWEKPRDIFLRKIPIMHQHREEVISRAVPRMRGVVVNTCFSLGWRLSITC